VNSIKNFFKSKIVENVLLFFLLLGVMITIFTPNLPFLTGGADLANQTMICYLGLSILFMIFGMRRLMIVAMISTAIFAFFLKETTNARIKYAIPNLSEKITLNLINLSSIDSDPIKVFNNIAKKSFDVMIFQEYTPNWSGIIEEKLLNSYPNSISLPRIDVYGLKVISKYPIISCDTFYYEEIPILKFNIQKNKSLFSVVTAYFPPPINKAARETDTEELNLIAAHLRKNTDPTIVAGVFNMVPWSQEIQQFKDQTELIDTRSGYIPSMDKSSGGIFGKPVTHIFYNRFLECTNFNISRADNDEYGIEAFFQLQDNDLIK